VHFTKPAGPNESSIFIRDVVCFTILNLYVSINLKISIVSMLVLMVRKGVS